VISVEFITRSGQGVISALICAKLFALSSSCIRLLGSIWTLISCWLGVAYQSISIVDFPAGGIVSIVTLPIKVVFVDMLPSDNSIVTFSAFDTPILLMTTSIVAFPSDVSEIETLLAFRAKSGKIIVPRLAILFVSFCSRISLRRSTTTYIS